MVGEKISFFRTSRRYTQEHMATKLGISQKSYSNIENNTKRPTEKELDIIASELGIPKESIKSTTPVIMINDAQNGVNFGNNVDQQSNMKELLQSIMMQLSKKDEQIEKLLHHIELLLQR
jgi:transcriptional regulator with XRE-family HTH domain